VGGLTVATSIREYILQNIKTALEVIRISNGYQVDIDNVQRWEQEGNELRQTPCVVVVPDDETIDDGPDPEVIRHLPVDLVLWYRHDKNKIDCSADEALSMFLADIEKAIMADHTRGGYAVTTSLKGNTPFTTAEGQPFCGFLVHIEVLYETRYNDPYS
jgi:hypothetical protein